MAPAGNGTVQNNPDGSIPGSQSWDCCEGSPTASTANKSIQTNANAPRRRRLAVSTNVPSMKRMSASKLYRESSLPVARPRISAAATVPLKSVIVAISKPGAGGPRWMKGSLGTRLKFSSKPLGIGFGIPVPGLAAAANAGSPKVAPTASPAVRPSRSRREMRDMKPSTAIVLPLEGRSQPRRARSWAARAVGSQASLGTRTTSFAAVLFQPRIAGLVVAFFPGAAVGLVVVGPVAVDGEVADGVIEDRLRDGVDGLDPREEVASRRRAAGSGR